jgi:hypothetical protein
METMNDMSVAQILLGILGAIMSLLAWAAVVFPQIPITWKGGNHASLSVSSRIAMAIGVTSWFLIALGFHRRFFVALFVISILYGFFNSQRDRATYDAVRGVVATSKPKLTFSQMWLALCLLDAFFLSFSTYTVIRDWFSPPHTDEQRILRIMAVGYFLASAAGAILLYVKRPQKRAS